MITPQKKEVRKTKTCCSCLKVKDFEKDFYRNKQYEDGKYSKCKFCLLKGSFCVKKSKEKKKTKRDDQLYLTGNSKNDWKEMYFFLNKIGYDLGSDLTIHQQFCLKYNLKERKISRTKQKYFSPVDLGLI